MNTYEKHASTFRNVSAYVILKDGRLKKRKVRGRAEVKVWIEAAPARPMLAAVNA